MSLAFENGTLAVLDDNDLPSGVRADIEIGKHLALTSGLRRGRSDVQILADSLTIGNWAMAANLASAKAIRRGDRKPLDKLQLCADSGANPGEFSDETRFLFKAAQRVRAEKNVGKSSRRIVLNGDGIASLADANSTSSGRDGLEIGPFVTPLGTNAFTPWLALDNAPQIGAQVQPVKYIDGVGKATEIASMGATPRSGITVKHAQAPVRVIAHMTDVDYLTSAEMAYGINGQGGVSQSAMNDLVSNAAMRARLTEVAINGDSAIGWKGATSTGSVGAGVSINKTAVNVSSATAADVHAAIVSAINTAMTGASDDPDLALDCVVFSEQVWAKLGEVSSGKTYMAMLVEHFAARGIPSSNWFVNNDLKNGVDEAYMLVTRIAPGAARPFMMVSESPVVLTYPMGAATQTYKLNACAGLWVPFAAGLAVVKFAYTP
jgi:hypothetical protein